MNETHRNIMEHMIFLGQGSIPLKEKETENSETIAIISLPFPTTHLIFL